MATSTVVAIRDSAVNAFQSPMFFQAAGAAIRAFGDAVQNPADGNPMFKHPEDHELFELGLFDHDTGVFQLHPQPRSIATGKQFKTN